MFMTATERLDRRIGWSRLPKPVALVTLMGLRMRLRRDNLFDPAGVTLPWAPSPLPGGERPLTRTADGTGNDLTHPEMGSVGALFGRNVPPVETGPVDVLRPNPRAVSLELLTRRRFVPATTLNVLAAAWLQFEVHDWFSHGSNEPETRGWSTSTRATPGRSTRWRSSGRVRPRPRPTASRPRTPTPRATGGTPPRSTAPRSSSSTFYEPTTAGSCS